MKANIPFGAEREPCSAALMNEWDKKLWSPLNLPLF
jgi:hypothetical protein